MSSSDDPEAVERRWADAKRAVDEGDVPRLRGLLDAHPDLATARLDDGRVARTLLHAVADWPGHRPDGAVMVALLVAAGADVDARAAGDHGETPLHWAASCDDVAVLDALLDAGADIEADGAVIGGGTALADATAFAQWQAARRLIARGARSTFWESAALGLLDRVRAHLDADPPPSAQAVTEAYWGACHGGQRDAAALLLSRGADPGWVGWDGLTAAEAAARNGF